MKYTIAAPNDCMEIYMLVQKTIRNIYPRYYPREVVDFFSELHSEENIMQDIENRLVGILLDGDTLVGTGTCMENHFTRVFVLPGYQRNGYGSHIMQQLEEGIGGKYDKICLDASFPAVAFYEKRGYATVRHETRNCRNGTVLVYGIMEKCLRQ